MTSVLAALPGAVPTALAEKSMNWARIERKWDRFAGQAKSEWTKFTDDEIKLVAGKKDALIVKVQEHYGVVKEDAERQVDAWFVKLSARHAEQSAKNGAPQ